MSAHRNAGLGPVAVADRAVAHWSAQLEDLEAAMATHGEDDAELRALVREHASATYELGQARRIRVAARRAEAACRRADAVLRGEPVEEQKHTRLTVSATKVGRA